MQYPASENKSKRGLPSLSRRLWSPLHYLGAHPLLLALFCAAIIAASVGIFGFSGWSIGVPVIVIAAVICIGVAHPRSNIFYPTISRGSPQGNEVALTFDDGPDPHITPGVLEALSRVGAHASFFAIGSKLAAQPELARRILAEGHELGNHSWKHSRLQNFRSTRFLQQDIKRGNDAITATGQAGAPLYRPPIGLKSPHLGHAAQRLGLNAMIAWSLHGRDTHGRDAEQIAARVLRKVRAGDIILLHDGHDLPGQSRPDCVEATALILAGLRERGLQSVSVSRLLRLEPQ